MKRVLALLVFGTVISGIAAYAATARNVPTKISSTR
jgi:hypothetical protein